MSGCHRRRRRLGAVLVEYLSPAPAGAVWSVLTTAAAAAATTLFM